MVESSKDVQDSADAGVAAHMQLSGGRNDTTNLSNAGQTEDTLWQRAVDYVFWVPPNCRWNPERPPKFSMGMNILFAFAGAFTVANLYYNHPILNILAHDFDVPYEKVAQIPTVAQAGYAGTFATIVQDPS